MAAVVGTIQAIGNAMIPSGPRRNTAGKDIEACIVAVSGFSGTYAQGAGAATISGIAAALQSRRRDGRTVTLLQACIAGPGSEAGVAQGALACTVAANVISTQLTTGDMATEHANGALGVYDNALEFLVFYVAV